VKVIQATDLLIWIGYDEGDQRSLLKDYFDSTGLLLDE
jgi:hypothetical protein